jgi:hypothetical protein
MQEPSNELEESTFELQNPSFPVDKKKNFRTPYAM